MEHLCHRPIRQGGSWYVPRTHACERAAANGYCRADKALQPTALHLPENGALNNYIFLGNHFDTKPREVHSRGFVRTSGSVSRAAPQRLWDRREVLREETTMGLDFYDYTRMQRGSTHLPVIIPNLAHREPEREHANAAALTAAMRYGLSTHDLLRLTFGNRVGHELFRRHHSHFRALGDYPYAISHTVAQTMAN